MNDQLLNDELLDRIEDTAELFQMDASNQAILEEWEALKSTLIEILAEKGMKKEQLLLEDIPLALTVAAVKKGYVTGYVDASNHFGEATFLASIKNYDRATNK